MLIAVHCEDETIIKNNTAHYKSIYGDDVPIEMHPKIRSDENVATDPHQWLLN